MIKINKNKIASGGQDKSIKIWDLITGNCIITLKGHSNNVSRLIKINKYQIASSSWDNSIKIWDIFDI